VTAWKLRDFTPGAGLVEGAHLPAHADADWLSVDVPGDVHRTLIDAGRIPDPYYAQNETECAWMEQREWWYRWSFDVPPGQTDHRLVFHGLDTFATIYLDGTEIGEQHNMFRPAVFDVTLHGGRHVLAVRFDPPLERIRGKTLSAWGRNVERTAMRKAQFGYGWDWGPRLPTIGIWRPVELRPRRGAQLEGVHFYTVDVRSERAAVAVRVDVARFSSAASLMARIELQGADRPPLKTQLELAGSDGVAYLTVDRPRLWWTHELGEPALYDLSVRLLDGDELLDEHRSKVGIRTLTLDQSPDPEERGTRFFRFVLNGVPIFAKGADWIPCDSFVGAIPPERYTRLLEQARDANMTMLRIWGGGIYEHDHFYNECDRLGMLVWQDFMFACAMYPEDDPDFVAEVDAEARYQVRRLRSHPSLALWCGNNENQWLHERNYWDRPELPAYGALYYDSILPRVVADLDGRTPYWPGSPYGGNDHNSREEGNVHNWEVWHGNFPRRFGEKPRRENTPEGVSYRRYAEDLGRFISEFGMHAAPQTETLWRVIPPEERYHHSPTLDWHNKDTPKNKGDNLLLATTGLPTDIDQYILFSQIAQAEGFKFGIEHFRRRKPHCSGTLVWQLDDCWPVLSWSVLDYYGFPKPSYYFLKRVYAPVLASFRDNELWLTSDRTCDLTDQVTVTLGTFDGRTEWQETREVAIAAGASACVWRLDNVQASPAHYLHVQSATGAFPPNRHFFSDIKDLVRQPVAPSMRVRQESANEARITLTAPPTGYVYFAHVVSPHESTRFSDNYIDLLPAETRELVVSDPVRELSEHDLRLGWA
jgi:beta-mannosidase